MTVALDPQLEKFIDDQVKSGRFSSSAQALAAGVARLMLDPDPDLLDQQDVKDIQQSLAEMRRGEVIDAAKVHAQLKQRFPTG